MKTHHGECAAENRKASGSAALFNAALFNAAGCWTVDCHIMKASCCGFCRCYKTFVYDAAASATQQLHPLPGSISLWCCQTMCDLGEWQTLQLHLQAALLSIGHDSHIISTSTLHHTCIKSQFDKLCCAGSMAAQAVTSGPQAFEWPNSASAMLACSKVISAVQ